MHRWWVPVTWELVTWSVTWPTFNVMIQANPCHSVQLWKSSSFFSVSCSCSGQPGWVPVHDSSQALEAIPFCHPSSRVSPLKASLKDSRWTSKRSPTLSLRHPSTYRGFCSYQLVNALPCLFMAGSKSAEPQSLPWLKTTVAYLEYFAWLWWPLQRSAPFHPRAHPSGLRIQKSKET